MSIPAIGAVGFTPYRRRPPSPSHLRPPASDAASQVGRRVGRVRRGLRQPAVQGPREPPGPAQPDRHAAVKAATGDLNAIHDYTITATEASVATQLTTAVRNKALEAFQEIMRMSV